MDDLDKSFEDDLEQAMKSNTVAFKQRTKPADIASVVHEATDQDTDRATRTMAEQMQKIAEGLKKDIEQATEVRDTVQRRIDNLTHALQATEASLKTLAHK